MKNREEILAHLRSVMVETFEIDPELLQEDADLQETLGLDSIDAVDMAVKIQEATGKKPSFGDLRGLTTLSDVVALIERQLADSAAKSSS